MKKFLLLSLFCLITAISYSQDTTRSIAEVKINVTDVRSNNGVIYVLVYESPIGFPHETNFARGLFVINVLETPTSSLELEGLPYGDYVFLVIHDQTRSGFPQINRTQVPRQAFGISNVFKLPFFMPKWDEAKVTIDQPEMVFDIKLFY